MIVARAWGCTPADLQRQTHSEYVHMVDQLTAELEARQRARR